ncbi:MAG: GTP-binding protein [Candidatus Lokiarchaeota archaeon]|nr:GTP-binding protein [Candidatus Lokiarchaeota archaeon]
MLYYRHFGKALKQEIFAKVVQELMADAFSGDVSPNSVQAHDYYKFKISYAIEPNLKLMFLFVTGLTDSQDSIRKELMRCKKEFLNLFEDILQHRFDAKTFEVFHPTIDSIHKNLKPKISLVGFSGVGKTTITRLIKAEEIPMKHVPTITGDIATIKIGKLHFNLWDFAGQEQFSYLWTNFIKGSDAVLLITDSSLENVEKSKFFLELIKEQAPNAHSAVIANKQDLPQAMKPEKIENIIGLKAYSMIAKNPDNRDKMIQIIADVLEMSAEVSPLLKPLLERDSLTEEAMKALEDTKFEEAALLFEKISDLCIELGDDSLGKEFYEKARKINLMLNKVGTPKKAINKPSTEQSEQVKPTPKPPEPKIPVTAEKPKVKPLPPKQAPPKASEPLEKPDKLKEAKRPVIEPKTVKEEVEKIEEPKPSELKLKEEAPEVKEEEKVEEIEEAIDKKEKKKKKKKRKKKFKKKDKKKEEYSPIKKEPSFLKKVTVPKAPPEKPEAPIEVPSTPKHDAELDDSWMPEKLKAIKRKSKKKSLEELVPAEDEDEIVIKPTIKQGLDLNPEDFMIRKRPKNIVEITEDKKVKLKTSPYGHVANPAENASTSPQTVNNLPSANSQAKSPRPKPPRPKASGPVDPLKMFAEKTEQEINKQVFEEEPKTEKPSEKTSLKEPVPHEPEKTESVEPSATAPTSTPDKKKELEDSLMDLKIKKANIQKMLLDLEMKEIMGEISSEELQEKKSRLDLMVNKINDQIKDLEEIVNT